MESIITLIFIFTIIGIVIWIISYIKNKPLANGTRIIINSTCDLEEKYYNKIGYIERYQGDNRFDSYEQHYVISIPELGISCFGIKRAWFMEISTEVRIGKLDNEDLTIKKKKGGVHMPRIFKWSFYFALVMLVYKFIFNIEYIIAFITNYLTK